MCWPMNCSCASHQGLLGVRRSLGLHHSLRRGNGKGLLRMDVKGDELVWAMESRAEKLTRHRVDLNSCPVDGA